MGKYKWERQRKKLSQSQPEESFGDWNLSFPISLSFIWPFGLYAILEVLLPSLFYKVRFLNLFCLIACRGGCDGGGTKGFLSVHGFSFQHPGNLVYEQQKDLEVNVINM